VGKDERKFVYETDFAEKTKEEKPFVEHLWARRKVGYLLDQIRANGEKKELVEEVVTLAKRYGIATPYTSHLIVPDGPVPVAGGAVRGLRILNGSADPKVAFALEPQRPGGQPARVEDFAKKVQAEGAELGKARFRVEAERLKAADEVLKETKGADKDGRIIMALKEAQTRQWAYEQAREALGQRQVHAVQGGKLGVELSVAGDKLRCAECLTHTAQCQVAGRTCMEVGGVWIDEGFDAKMPTCTVKAMSDAYFRILERQPRVREVFRLGNHLVWVTPSGTALIVDLNDGKEQLPDAEIDKLFVARR